ncbi:hypothetical protein CBR_g19984 [Chara braunii]|uniref:Alpha 1,4-glycosyltransferase domain-containing protein n=1 Tax=Chara braunii TaxID=69332 RepID=A0A388KZ90_CHABU|nr:hypothetical protein CBR_g19984 [Chara braunii]|eukprot:GBG75351.1 hypothetical protein CBR_g19984 [Chara braunii]
MKVVFSRVCVLIGSWSGLVLFAFIAMVHLHGGDVGVGVPYKPYGDVAPPWPELDSLSELTRSPSFDSQTEGSKPRTMHNRLHRGGEEGEEEGGKEEEEEEGNVGDDRPPDKYRETLRRPGEASLQVRGDGGSEGEARPDQLSDERPASTSESRRESGGQSGIGSGSPPGSASRGPTSLTSLRKGKARLTNGGGADAPDRSRQLDPSSRLRAQDSRRGVAPARSAPALGNLSESADSALPVGGASTPVELSSGGSTGSSPSRQAGHRDLQKRAAGHYAASSSSSSGRTSGSRENVAGVIRSGTAERNKSDQKIQANDCPAGVFARNRIRSAADFENVGSIPSFFTRLPRPAPSAALESSQGRRDSRASRGGGATTDTDDSNPTRRDTAPQPPLTRRLTRAAVVPYSNTTKIPDHVFFLNMYHEIRGCAHTHCSVESFLNKNPNYTVYFYSSNQTYFRTKWSERKDPRIVLKSFDFVEIFRGTPLEKWYTSGTYRNTSWIPNNLSNAARYALLWKYGGTYLDMDFISLNALPVGLGSALAAEDDKSINNAFVRFAPGHKFLLEAMEDFVRNFNGYEWGNQGPKLLTRVYMRNCLDINAVEEWLVSHKNVSRDKARARARSNTGGHLNASRLSASYIAPDFCYDLPVLSWEYCYPIYCGQPWEFKQAWKKSCKQWRQRQEKAIMVHYWGHYFPHNDTFDKDSVMAEMMRGTCPRTYHQCGWESRGL